MRIVFAMKETVMNRYSVEVPKKLENASDEELLEWVNSGNVFDEPVEFEKDSPTKAISFTDGKEYTVYKVIDNKIEIKNKTYPIKLCNGYYIIRKLTIEECKRLQTVPEWYEFPVSDTQALKQIGNGWTVEVIIHLIKAIIE